MRYKSTVEPVPQIARELNVQAIVEGTVLRSAGRVRIRVQLIDARSDTHLWAEAYERKQQDAMSLQNEVAGAIARQINFELTPQRNGPSSTIPEPNFEAQSAYLKGRYFWNERNDYGMRKAFEYFQQAIALDPKYARAYVGLADCYVLGAPPTDSPNVLAPKIRDLLKKALEIDDSLGEAHATLGLLAQNHDWDWAEAEKQYKLAIYLSPNYATAHQWYAEYLTLRGKLDLAFEQMKLARDLDPLSLVIIKDSGELDYNAGNYDEAIEYLHKALEMDPNFITAHRLLAMTYVQKKEFSPAIAELLKSSQIEAAPDTVAELGYVYAVAGRKQDAEKVLKDLKVMSEQRYTCARDYALIYVGLGEKDKAFEWLDKAYREKAQLVELKTDPRWNSLRTDSRFSDLMRRMGLTS
jgi:tetratricopeptide (TPR) repeat protein